MAEPVEFSEPKTHLPADRRLQAELPAEMEVLSPPRTDLTPEKEVFPKVDPQTTQAITGMFSNKTIRCQPHIAAFFKSKDLHIAG